MFFITFKVGGEIKGLSKLTSDVREELLVEIKWAPINLYLRSNEYLYLRSSGTISLSWISLFGIKCANVFILFNLSERIFKCGNIFIWVRFHLSELREYWSPCAFDVMVALLRQKAAEVGANAVVGIRMETNTIFDGCLDLVIYGTAIRFTR